MSSAKWRPFCLGLTVLTEILEFDLFIHALFVVVLSPNLNYLYFSVCYVLFIANMLAFPPSGECDTPGYIQYDPWGSKKVRWSDYQ